MRKIFKARAVWDEDANVFYSDSNISGLHIEAETLDEFEDILFSVAPGLIISNHTSAEDINGPQDVIPAFIYEKIPRPELVA